MPLSPSPPLVLTKVQLPRLRSSLVLRSRLLQRLQEGMHGPLTLLSAPAGFGKTTLLTSWLHTNDVSGAWFSVEVEDNDPVRFFTYLLTALQGHEQRLGNDLLPLLQSGGPGSLETVLALLINEVTSWPGPRLVLILDDYHVITTQAIHQALAYLVEHLPSHLHLVIATRADPPLPLARLRARGHLVELRATDLRFAPQEAEQFLHQVMSLDLSVQESGFLQSRTEGWIAGLQFAALALQGRTEIAAFLAAFSGSHRFVLDYLSEEVLARQTPALLSFLLSTSILERLSGSLCDAVTEQNDSQTTLEALERANLFVVSLDDERHWYRYHHLFAEVLRNRLQQSQPELIPVLHQRASFWFEQHGSLVEAVQHALAAHDVELAARLIERIALPAILQGQFSTVSRWLKALPEVLVQTRPFLCIPYAAVLVLSNQFEIASVYLQEVERSVQKELSAEQTQTIRGWVLTLRANIALFSGDIAQAVFLAQQALEVLPEVEVLPRADAFSTAIRAYLVSGDVTPATEREVTAAVAFVRASSILFATVGSMTLLARLHVLQGKLRQAAATYAQVEQVVPRPELLHTFLTSLFYYFSLGDLLREWNQLEEAERHLLQGMALVKEKPTLEPFVVQLGYTTLARLQQARGNSRDALATLDALAHVAEQRNFPPHLRIQVNAELIQIELAQGNLAAALPWAETCGLSVKDELSFPREREYLTLARVRIAQGRARPSGPFLADALALLERLLAEAKPKNRLHSVLEMLVLTALALQARGDLQTAQDTLAEALSQAAPEGYVRLFLDEGAPLLALLSQVGKTHPLLHGYVRQLLAQADVAPASLDQQPARRQPLVEPLSERELEVLHLLAGGASNDEIAERLVIATGTVKRHVSNILAKLAVSNRTQAVAYARQLDLL